MQFRLSSLNMDNLKKGMEHLRTTTLPDAVSKVRARVTGAQTAYDRRFREQREADEEELARQREKTFSYAPCISIVVPVYMTPELSLRAMIESVQKQTYGNWELCLVDGSQAQGAPPVIASNIKDASELSVIDKVYSLETERIIHQYMDKDERIRYKKMDVNQGISGNSNAGLVMATGDYVALLDHDDVLTEDALYCVVEALQEQPYDVLYTDADHMTENGRHYKEPRLKPDFNIDLLRTYNYIGHLFVAKRDLLLACGGFHSEYDGAQNYDMILRCCEQGASVRHVARVLYHARIKSANSEEQDIKRNRIRTAGKEALEAHLRRMHLFASVTQVNALGAYTVAYDTPGNPLVSIVITGHTNQPLMEKMLEPFYEKTRYSNFEIVIVNQDYADAELQKYYQKIQGLRRNMLVIQAPQEAGKAELKNLGVSKTNGDYLLFLDSNIEILDSTAIGCMLGICMRDDTGIVSGVLYDDRDTVFHAGLKLGGKELFTYRYKGIRRADEQALQRMIRVDDTGTLRYFGMNYDYSAVADHCMLVKRSVYEQIGGFSDKFKTELSNLDFCLRVREHGLLVVSAAHAEWRYHDLPDAVRLAREAEKADADTYRREHDLFEILWVHILKNGDPFCPEG